MKLAIKNSDSIGALASTLCLIHCLATPFIFVVQSCTAACCANAPGWWASFDYIFLLISFVSIYRSTQTTTKKIMKPILWSNFFLLFALIKAIVPRYRYDQLMRLGWKIFLPFSLIYLVLTASFLFYFDKLPKGNF